VTVNKSSVAVIGAGNWGGSLVAALKNAKLGPQEIVRRDWQRTKLDARVIWICVPDAAIAEVAEKIAARRGNLRGQIVVHSSGALAAAVLEPARRAGAKIAAVHPVMSFPTRKVVPLKSVMFGVEAQGASVRKELMALVRRLGGAPFAMKADKKALYHAAGTFASPLLVAELTAAMETARLAGLSDKTAQAWVKALVEVTVANVFARGAAKSFSGPFARGDAKTIHLHLEALEAHPMLTEIYRALGRYAVGARQAVEALPVKNRRELEKAIGKRRIH
jgi:predicted short-subunit dehydrogenase-like oxidoreductase (DUF2520 family)